MVPRCGVGGPCPKRYRFVANRSGRWCDFRSFHNHTRRSGRHRILGNWGETPAPEYVICPHRLATRRPWERSTTDNDNHHNDQGWQSRPPESGRQFLDRFQRSDLGRERRIGTRRVVPIQPNRTNPQPGRSKNVRRPGVPTLTGSQGPPKSRQRGFEDSRIGFGHAHFFRYDQLVNEWSDTRVAIFLTCSVRRDWSRPRSAVPPRHVAAIRLPRNRPTSRNIRTAIETCRSL
ncbi:MAG: hypothetical protein Ct9H300mP1_13650 [Planctomycetaceae bacterium]|nr:MAG: hypothetical protein Ct9H300mP1_13650 [Planctomycetaceae bacterium]